MKKLAWVLTKDTDCDCCTAKFIGVFSSERAAWDYVILRVGNLPFLENWRSASGDHWSVYGYEIEAVVIDDPDADPT